MDWITTFAAFVVAISVLVAVHEYGHYWVARRLGFKVVRFSIGFGKPLWKRVAGADRTEYVIAAIPLGGYVKLLDEREGPVPTAELARSFMRKPVWQRLLVLIAGPVFNFLFAIVAYWGLFIYGVPQTQADGMVKLSDQEAARLDIKVNEFITAVLSLDVHGDDFKDKVNAIHALGHEEIRAAAGASNRFLDRPIKALNNRHYPK